MDRGRCGVEVHPWNLHGEWNSIVLSHGYDVVNWFLVGRRRLKGAIDAAQCFHVSIIFVVLKSLDSVP